MANYYTLTCFAVKATQAQADYLSDIFKAFDEAVEGKSDEDSDITVSPDIYKEVVTKFEGTDVDSFIDVDTRYDGDDGGFYIDGSESPNINGLIGLLEMYLEKFEIDQPITMSWATTCSKSRVDAFGGGAAVIRRTGTKWMNTSQWLAENS